MTKPVFKRAGAWSENSEGPNVAYCPLEGPDRMTCNAFYVRRLLLRGIRVRMAAVSNVTLDLVWFRVIQLDSYRPSLIVVIITLADEVFFEVLRHLSTSLSVTASTT